MNNLSLTNQEIDILKMSVNHCLETCKQGGANSGCSDCKTLEQVAAKINTLQPVI